MKFNNPSSDLQVLWLSLLVLVGNIVIFDALDRIQNQLKPGPNEFRGHVYGNKITLPSKELKIVMGIIKHDPQYDGAMILEEGEEK